MLPRTCRVSASGRLGTLWAQQRACHQRTARVLAPVLSPTCRHRRHGHQQQHDVGAPTPGTRPKARVCVVGSGPGGFYAVEALLRLQEDATKEVGSEEVAGIEVDVFERQAVPYGLVRFGVAPDHPEVKAVQNRYDAFMDHPRLRFIGNVSVGSTSSPSSTARAALSVEELLEAYDAVVLAAGAQLDRSLGIEGEELPSVHSAREFVGWYNGDPNLRDRHFDLASSRDAVVIGQGNVALDVARILLQESEQLASTDIASYACEALRRSKISTVHIVGRRGPAQASFTNKEVREILNMPNVVSRFLPEGVLSLNEASKLEISKERGKKRMIDLFVNTEKKTRAEPGVGEPAKKKLYFHFLQSPIRFLASDDGKRRVAGVELATNQLHGEAGHQKAVSTGQHHILPCDIVFKSIGYKSEPLEGVPFDVDRGVVPNKCGRVMKTDGRGTVSGLYVSGWMKRGPSGVIGTNRMDAEETIAALWQDLQTVQPQEGTKEAKGGWEMIEHKLRHRQVPFVQWSQWKAIEAEEHSRGQALGKEREKITHLHEMLDIAFKQ